MIKCSALLTVLYLLREYVAKLSDQRNNKHPKILRRGAEIKLDDINLPGVLNGDSSAVMVEDCHITFYTRFDPCICNNDCIAPRIQPVTCYTNSSHHGIYSKIDT